MAKIVGTWEGGRVIEKKNGKHVFYIRKRIEGRLFEKSTGATTLHAALKQLERFQASPATYTPSGIPLGKALTIEALLDEYIDYCRAKGNSANWRYQKRRYLSWWSKAMPLDIRAFTRERVLAVMSNQRVPHNRLASLKAFFTWAREVRGSISRAEDVTLDIAIQAPKPAQWTKPRATTRAIFRATVEHLEQPYRDIAELLGATGMHTTEALRLARGQGSVVGTTVTIFHKAGRQHRVEVDATTAEVAKRLMARGGFSVSRLGAAVRRACDKAGVARWAPGALRHSVATWLIGDGASIEAVAAYLNHDVATLRRFYSVAVIPRPMVAGRATSPAEP